jgi:hypothetical protein
MGNTYTVYVYMKTDNGYEDIVVWAGESYLRALWALRMARLNWKSGCITLKVRHAYPEN